MWKLKNSVDAVHVKTLLESCKEIVPGILSFEVGIRQDGKEANVDVVLISSFEDEKSLEGYQVHPHHKSISGQIGPLRESRYVLDF